MRKLVAAVRTPVAVLCLLLIASTAGAATARGADATGWAALAAPGTHAIMRHAIAPGTGDPADFRLGDCATQRNLDETGREQARAIGRAIRDRNIRIDRVLTSQWCRSAETARLLDVAPVTEEPALNSFFGDRRGAGPVQTARVRDILAALPEDEKVVLVTHQVNITALTGVFPASGEVVVISAGDDGSVAVEGRIRTEVPPGG